MGFPQVHSGHLIVEFIPTGYLRWLPKIFTARVLPIQLTYTPQELPHG
jgi:hypothetical protein